MYFCWSAEGQLRRVRTGAGGDEVRQAACGESHSLLLLSNGTVHSCGDNSRGQLGRRGKPREEQPGKRQNTGAGRGDEQDGALGALSPLGLQEMGNFALPERSCSSFVFQTRLGLFRFPIPLQRKTERETVSQAELDRSPLNRDVVLPFRDQFLPA